MSKQQKTAPGKRRGNWTTLERPEPHRYFVSELPRMQPVDYDWVVRFFRFEWNMRNVEKLGLLLKKASERNVSIEDYYQWSLVNVPSSRFRTPNSADNMVDYAYSLTQTRNVIQVVEPRSLA